MKRVSIFGLVRRGWIVLVVAVVSGGVVFGVYRLHGVFGSHDVTATGTGIGSEIVPFNPKHVTYEVFGAAGAVATIHYLDVNAAPHWVEHAPLPWKYEDTTTEPAVVGNLVAQGDGGTLGCRITIDGEVKDERTVTTASAYTFCLDKSG